MKANTEIFRNPIKWNQNQIFLSVQRRQTQMASNTVSSSDGFLDFVISVSSHFCLIWNDRNLLFSVNLLSVVNLLLLSPLEYQLLKVDQIKTDALLQAFNLRINRFSIQYQFSKFLFSYRRVSNFLVLINIAWNVRITSFKIWRSRWNYFQAYNYIGCSGVSRFGPYNN